MSMSQHRSVPGASPALYLRRGDHIQAGWPGSYHHDGVYLGDGRVIHLVNRSGSGKAGSHVQIGTLETFADGRPVTVRRYKGERDPEETVAQAMSRLGEGDYHLILNNCQHFARWCVTGDHVSEQVEDGTAVAGSIAVPMMAAPIGVNGVISSAGLVKGLSGPGVMSGLAKCGSLAGGGAVDGMVLLAALSGLATVAIVNTTAFRNDEDLPEDECKARADGRAGAVTGAIAGTAGGIVAVSKLGVPGLSGPGITSGLAALGTKVGGGMARGTLCVIAVPAITAAIVGYLAYKRALRRSAKPVEDAGGAVPELGVLLGTMMLNSPGERVTSIV